MVLEVAVVMVMVVVVARLIVMMRVPGAVSLAR